MRSERSDPVRNHVRPHVSGRSILLWDPDGAMDSGARLACTSIFMVRFTKGGGHEGGAPAVLPELGDCLASPGDFVTPNSCDLGPQRVECDALRRPDPARVWGFVVLFCLWLRHAAGELTKGRLAARPNFWNVGYFLPSKTGGSDFGHGKIRGGPMVFWGVTDEGYTCVWARPLEERVYFAVRSGRLRRVGWVLRKPKEYGYSPKSRYTTSQTLAAMQEA